LLGEKYFLTILFELA